MQALLIKIQRKYNYNILIVKIKIRLVVTELLKKFSTLSYIIFLGKYYPVWYMCKNITFNLLVYLYMMICHNF